MKKKFTLFLAIICISTAQAQNTAIRLCDFDTVKKVSFADYNGMLDSMMTNPLTTGANNSPLCARYIRSTTNYDNLKLYVKTEFIDVAPFAQANTPNKISLMVMSTMPVGSRIEVQLGARELVTYPEGIHSVYSATTTMQRQWEKLNFNLSSNLSGNGGFSNAGNCNKLVLLFNPNATTTDTIYFDEVMGPQLKEAVGIKEQQNTRNSNLYATPNPAKDQVSLNFELKNSGPVSLSLTDVLGRNLLQPISLNLSSGPHALPLDTSNYPDGIYFYTLKTENQLETKRLVINR
jgi:hypothetical protein